jgi:hypothetical protein
MLRFSFPDGQAGRGWQLRIDGRCRRHFDVGCLSSRLTRLRTSFKARTIMALSPFLALAVPLGVTIFARGRIDG